jgi:hypothetical protein
MNPPYGRSIGKWMRKAHESALAGATIVCLVPARTDTAWWHDYAMRGEVEFIRGRLKFGRQQQRRAVPVCAGRVSRERNAEARGMTCDSGRLRNGAKGLANASHRATREEWRLCGHPRYQVSSEGRVKSNVGREPRILTPVADNYGYLTVKLHSRRYKIHRLVCEAFHGPPPAKADAAHLDGSRVNNAAANLAWVSRKENMAHKLLHGTHQTGESHGSAKLTATQVAAARERAEAGESHKSIARSLGVSGTQIDRIVSGAQWAVSPSQPSGRVSAFAAIYDQLMRPSENVAWLERAGPIAKRLNEESRRD